MSGDYEYQSSSRPEFKGTKQLIDTEIGLLKYSTAIVCKIHQKLGLSRNIRLKSMRILDFGAGTGFLAEIFKKKFGVIPDCVELDPTLKKLLLEKGFICFQTLKEVERSYNYIYTSNVLEHIPNDTTALSELYDALVPGGMIAIYVPAHPILFGEMDKLIGHVRRYEKKELYSKVASVGFEVNIIHYDDFLGFFVSYFIKRIGYKENGKLGSNISLIIYDRLIYPISKLLDGIGLRYILGKNLILIATKPANRL
jgi:SAM-dependent methyltransferase